MSVTGCEALRISQAGSPFIGALSLLVCVCVFFFYPVLSVAEEALLSDCQDLSNPNQTVLLSSTWQHHQGHAHLQEGRTCHRSGQTLPQPWTRTRLQWWYEAWFLDQNQFFSHIFKTLCLFLKYINNSGLWAQWLWKESIRYWKHSHLHLAF